jgi:RND family efflux transporter MFP subunit
MTRTLANVNAIIIVLTLMFMVGCGDDTPAAKNKEAPKVTVVHPVVRSLTDTDDYNGWLEAYKSVDVCPRVSGYITKVYFKDGDMVTEGKTPLFDIDPDPFRAQLAQIEAQRASLVAQQIAAANVVKRNQELIKTNAVSQQELEKSIADENSFESQIKAKDADADRVKLDLKYAKIIAPLTGKVGKANYYEGATVTAVGVPPVLTTIVTVTPVYVDFNVDERAIQRYQQSALGKAEAAKPFRERNYTFHFGLDTEKGYPHEAHLVFADIKYAEGTGTVLIRGEADNKDSLFVPGSRVRVRLPTSDKYPATQVPDTAICTDQKEKYILEVGADKNVKRVNVELGRLLDDGMRVILTPELKPDSWIISEGMERVRRNYQVDPVPETAEAVASTSSGS